MVEQGRKREEGKSHLGNVVLFVFKSVGNTLEKFDASMYSFGVGISNSVFKIIEDVGFPTVESTGDRLPARARFLEERIENSSVA